eukprot:TRINITY_DN5128_c0_g1_i1.p1 TRINITY_DN5128_c0_g1~~TRINITY_DN5128_c0_g1_i1.p1  ORF type:complete len:285 (+),score=44.80 TRINITY_DN5128_c0_g1_i1:676-1530(+)
MLVCSLWTFWCRFWTDFSFFFRDSFLNFQLAVGCIVGGVALLGVPFLRKYVPDEDSQYNTPLLEGEDRELPNVPEKISFWKMLMKFDFWLLWVCFASAIGSSLVIINNVGSVFLSLGGKEGAQDGYVIVLSCANAVGTVCFGLISDAFERFGRATFLFFATLTLMASYLIMATVDSVEVLYPGVALAGLGAGGLWSLILTMVSTIFGVHHWGLKLGVFMLAPLPGNYLLSTILAGRIYQSNIHDGGLECFGEACYRNTFFITAGVCGFSLLLNAILIYRQKKRI